MKQLVSDKTYEKINWRDRRTDYRFGWCEERYCARCNQKVWHDVYLNKLTMNASYTQYLPMKIGFYVCNLCGNFQRA